MSEGYYYIDIQAEANYYGVIGTQTLIHQQFVVGNSSTGAPTAPTNFTATYVDNERAFLSWSPCSGATSYEVQYWSPTNSTWLDDDSYSSGTSYTSKGLKNYSSWQFRVRAVNSVGASGWTNCSYNKSATTITGNCGINGTNLTYTLSSDGILTIRGNGAMADYTNVSPDGTMGTPSPWYSDRRKITRIIIESGVTSIGTWAFYNCTNTTSVSIPSSVTTFEEAAFFGCSGLTEVTIPSSITELGNLIFAYCTSLSLISLPDNLQAIGDNAFMGCSQLNSVSIPHSVSLIGCASFQGCTSLTSVNIPESVTSIVGWAFYECSSLKDVYYGGTEAQWKAITIEENNEPLTNATIHYGAMDSDTIVSTGFQFGVDTFSFDNDFLAFGNSHYISGNDYKELLKTMPLFWELVFKYDDMYDRTFSKNQFNGVCFGISALMALVYYDYISLDPYVSMCVEPYQLPLPKDYPDLNSLFNYVYGLQFRFKPLLFDDPQWLCGKTVVQDLLNKKLVIINFPTHAVLGYAIDAQSDDECYIVYCADPNKLTGIPLRLKISKRTYELVDTKRKFSFIFDDFELMATLLPQSTNRINNETQYSKASLFATNSSSFVISGDGKTSTVCGNDISGDFPIDAMHFVYGDEVHSNVYSISISSGYNVLFTDEAKHYAAAYFPESNVVSRIESTADEITVMPAGELRFSGAIGSTSIQTNAAFDEYNTLISISGTLADLQMIPSYDKLTMLSDTGIDGLNITITSDTKQDSLEADVDGQSATLVQRKADGLEPYYSLLRDDNTTIIDTPHDYVLFNVSTLGLDNSATIYIDGIEYQLESDDSIIINDANAHTMVTYSYNNPKATDVHTQYPTGMKVWKLKQENGVYTAEYVPEFDNLLQYSGSSIRITGNKGIRMITSVNQDTRNKLTGSGLAGFKLLEYGTLLAQTSKLGNNPLVLGGANVKSNYAYKKGVADPVFKYTNGLIQYTNVLVGFTDEQCKEDIAMRPYMKLQDENGEEFIIYGGIVYRSIGYIAYQNRKAFQPGSAAYEYVWSIIHNVYGNQYDSEYKK